MRKRLITPISQDAPRPDEGWLNLDHAASVEVTSEQKDYGIDAALVSGETQGWRADNTGTQTIRLLFDQPQSLRRISLVFEETETARTQEFVCDGLQMAGARFEKSCVSSRISAHPTPHARSRNITFNSRMSPFSNWSWCLTSVEERLAPRSRVCARVLNRRDPLLSQLRH
jgi:hypothetical protein